MNMQQEQKKENKRYGVQVFYTKSQALQIEISTNGIFFDIAPALAESDRYNWEAKKGAKFSISEVSNMAHAMEVFRINGAEAYANLAQSIFGEKYKNMQFVHRNRSNQTVRTGLNLYNNSLSFIIVNDEGKVKINFPILPTEKIRLEKFLSFVISMAFTKGI